MNPEQLLDYQADLRHWTSTDLFHRYVANVVGSVLSTAPDSMPSTRQDWMAARLASALPVQAAMAEAYRVAGDMCMVVQHAADGLDEDDLFDRNLAPTPFGLVHFERPLPVLDARGRAMSIDWALWGQTTDRDGTPGIVVSWFNDHLANSDSYAREIIAESEGKIFDVIGRWSFIGCDMLPQGRSLGPSRVPLTDLEQARLISEGATPHSHSNTSRYLYALWMLLGQSVTRVESEHVRKTALRRALRVGLPGRVSVIALRRTASSAREKGESLIDWAHRWLVRGHWRWQPYGERLGDHAHDYGPAGWDGYGYSVRTCTRADCDATLRRIWINMQVRGPEDKPLVVTSKVYDLRR